jgi:hypothetical protein
VAGERRKFPPLSQLKKGANNDENDEESGKENKDNGNGVDERCDGDNNIGGNGEKSSANENNDRGIIRRMVVMTKQTVMEIEQTVMEMITNQGKMVELMVVERRIAVMKKKQMMSRIKKVKKMMDVVMEIMAVMIIMTKSQQKKMDMRRNQDLLLRILSNQKKPQPY